MTSHDPAIAEHQEAVGARLRQSIVALGLSYSEAARAMGISPQRLNGWMSGEHPVSLFHMARFCRAFPVTADFLLLGDARGLPYETAKRLGLVNAAR